MHMPVGSSSNKSMWCGMDLTCSFSICRLSNTSFQLSATYVIVQQLQYRYIRVYFKINENRIVGDPLQYRSLFEGISIGFSCSVYPDRDAESNSRILDETCTKRVQHVRKAVRTKEIGPFGVREQSWWQRWQNHRCVLPIRRGGTPQCPLAVHVSTSHQPL